MLAPGNGKTKTGRLWTYVRDDRPAGDTAAPAVWFAYSPDRKGEHPEQHLRTFQGALQADAYAGFNQLYEDGRIQEAACWAHVRRKFYDLQQAHASPIASEALERIAALYAIEERDPRAAPRRATTSSPHSGPTLARVPARLVRTSRLTKLSRKSDTTAAIRYALDAGTALTRYCDDGRLEIDNNAAERALARRRSRPQELSVCRIRRRRRAGRRDLQPDRHGETQRPRSRSLFARGAAPHRRSSHQPHRGAAALESRRQRATRKRSRSVDQEAIVNNSTAVSSAANIEELLAVQRLR